MIQLTSLISYLDSLLQPRLYKDAAYNGLQVESQQTSVRKVAFAVDSGRSVIESATNIDADLLVVHHGLFWGEQLPVVGAHAEKLGRLLRGGCSLYASHLPLDGNSEVGNGYELARFLGLEKLRGFCELDGMTVGAAGEYSKPVTIDHVLEQLAEIEGVLKPLLVLPFGSESVQHVGVVTGSGTFALNLCKEHGLDLLISGEPKQEAYHLASDLECNGIFAGHYATETFGLRALQKRVAQDFDVETSFIELPTGI